MSKVRWVMAAVAAMMVLASAGTAFAGNGTPINSGSANVLTMAVYGDSPYGTSNSDTAQFDATPAFIDSVNSDPQVDLVIHVGDIHSGKQSCTAAYDQSIFDLWTRFKDPVVYTPGDNEWTDCNKPAEGGGDPIANLQLIRSTFFPTAGVTLGGRKKQVISQAQVVDPSHPTDANYVENVMWEQSKTLFVTINLPGGSNNDADIWFGAATMTQAQSDEIAQRTGADLRWLDAAFAQAQSDDVQAVVIIAQADMWDPEKGAAHQANYEPFVASVATHTLAFGKPVLMFNGDSHVYRSDNPLVDNAACVTEAGACSNDAYDMHPGYNVANFHRIVVHGSNAPGTHMEWLKLTVDPRADNTAGPTTFGPFTWQRMTQPLP